MENPHCSKLSVCSKLLSILLEIPLNYFTYIKVLLISNILIESIIRNVLGSLEDNLAV